jgi:hypothetical protein
VRDLWSLRYAVCIRRAFVPKEEAGEENLRTGSAVRCGAACREAHASGDFCSWCGREVRAGSIKAPARFAPTKFRQQGASGRPGRCHIYGADGFPVPPLPRGCGW